MAEKSAISNFKLFIWALGNTVITVLISSGINFYFQQKSLKDEKLISYRSELVKNYTSPINEAIALIEAIESHLNRMTVAEINSSNEISDQEAIRRRHETIESLNKLGDFAFKLPYQMRVVLITAKNHYGTIFWNKSVPISEKQKLKTENLTAKSFEIAFEIAKENYILNGEPRHDELSELLR
ncbi:hypothetical protein [Bdellovibrio sp. HCB337]|uniref:hypothetical protein n=1 Tax=Bdellovibrio sp. HCB337 TaxID=3394358 RepID=UPI0039A405FD